jgi:RNA polymerase sigma factor (sigma-70 family)
LHYSKDNYNFRLQFKPLMTAKQFNCLIILYQSDLTRYAHSLTGNPEDIQDLVQTTYLKALVNRDKYYDDTNLKAWLMTILKNSFLNSVHKNRSRFIKYFSDLESFEQFQYTPGSMHPESIYAEKELLALMETIDPVHLKTFQMKLQGYKYEEIAAEMGTGEETVKSRVYYARKKIIDIINS